MKILRTAINLRGKSVCHRNVYAILIPSKTTIFENTNSRPVTSFKDIKTHFNKEKAQKTLLREQNFVFANVILCYVCVYDRIIVWNLASLNCAALLIL